MNVKGTERPATDIARFALRVYEYFAENGWPRNVDTLKQCESLVRTRGIIFSIRSDVNRVRRNFFCDYDELFDRDGRYIFKVEVGAKNGIHNQ